MRVARLMSKKKLKTGCLLHQGSKWRLMQNSVKTMTERCAAWVPSA